MDGGGNGCSWYDGMGCHVAAAIECGACIPHENQTEYLQLYRIDTATEAGNPEYLSGALSRKHDHR